jgi:hypothetical protein
MVNQKFKKTMLLIFFSFHLIFRHLKLFSLQLRYPHVQTYFSPQRQLLNKTIKLMIKALSGQSAMQILAHKILRMLR